LRVRPKEAETNKGRVGMSRRRTRLVGLGVLSLLAITLLAVAPSPAGARTASNVDATFEFPSANSEVVGSVGFIDDDEVGFFWSAARGDRVSENFSGPRVVRRAILDVEVVQNALNSGAFVDWDLVIDGNVVGSFTVPEGFLGPVHLDVTFPAIRGRHDGYDVTIRVTNEVAPGQGSHTLAYAGAFAHSVKLKK
jgi:hypothetical protein